MKLGGVDPFFGLYFDWKDFKKKPLNKLNFNKLFLLLDHFFIFQKNAP